MQRDNTNRHRRKMAGKMRLRGLYANGGAGYPWPVGWSEYEKDSSGRGTGPAPGAYLKRYWRRRESGKLKRRCSRRLRRRLKNAGYECGNGCAYRRHTEFWREYD